LGGADTLVRRLSRLQKPHRAPQAQGVVSDAGNGASHSQSFNDLEGLVNHEWLEAACLENRQRSGFGLPLSDSGTGRVELQSIKGRSRANLPLQGA